MADKPPAKADPIKELKWFGMFLLVMVILWVIGGGPKDLMVRNGVFLKPPAPLNNGEIYGKNPLSGLTSASSDKNRSASPLSGLIQIERGSSVGASAAEEYLVLRAPIGNGYGINLTGFRLLATPDGPDITIGEGDRIKFGRTDTRSADMVILPGERAYVVTSDDANVSLPGTAETFWVSYLGKATRVWPSSGTILLLDRDGKTVSSIAY